MRLALKAIIRKEFRQVLRDPRTLGILLLVPLLLLVLFGYAISMDIESITVGILDEDRTPESRRLADLMRAPDLFVPGDAVLETTADADDALTEGRMDAVVVIPPGYGRELIGGEGPTVQVLIDGSNVTVASTSQSSIEAALADLNGRLAMEWRTPEPYAIAPKTPVDFRPRTWFNPELRSAVFLVPGLISFIMVITAVISTALSVVREKEKGTMEMLEAAPLRPVVLILGKTIPYMVISLAETVLILFAGRLLFGVVVQGSYWALALVTVLFVLSCLGMGLFISTIAESQQAAFLIATVVTVLPAFILSGFVFPIRNMPVPVQLVTFLIPGKYFLAAERALMIRGAGFAAIWKECLALAFFSVLLLVVSSRRLARGRSLK